MHAGARSRVIASNSNRKSISRKLYSSLPFSTLPLPPLIPRRLQHRCANYRDQRSYILQMIHRRFVRRSRKRIRCIWTSGISSRWHRFDLNLSRWVTLFSDPFLPWWDPCSLQSNRSYISPLESRSPSTATFPNSLGTLLFSMHNSPWPLPGPVPSGLERIERQRGELATFPRFLLQSFSRRFENDILSGCLLDRFSFL